MTDISALILALLVDGPRPDPYLVAVSGRSHRNLKPILAVLERDGKIKNVKRGCRAMWELA